MVENEERERRGERRVREWRGRKRGGWGRGREGREGEDRGERPLAQDGERERVEGVGVVAGTNLFPTPRLPWV